MEHFTADALKAEREQAVKAALKANIPWPDIVADYGVTLEQIMEMTGNSSKGERRGSAVILDPTKASLDDDWKDARKEVRHG